MGSLRDLPLSELATTAVSAALSRLGADPKVIGHVVMGNASFRPEPRDAYLSRVAAIDAGVPHEVPAFNVNRLCGSGLQAIISAAQSIKLGDCDVAIGAGAEAMRRGPYTVPKMRWSARMLDACLVDYMNGILHDPWQQVHMGITAENVAQRMALLGQCTLESPPRVERAIANGYFKEQIVPVNANSRKGTVLFDTDEHVRHDLTFDAIGTDEAGIQEGERHGHRRQRLGTK